MRESFSFQLSYFMDSQRKVVRRDLIVWKDVQKLNDPLTKIESERFFACMMFLFIMPPKYLKENGQPLWRSTVKETRNSPYYPQCRYDELVASHSTCCQHNTLFFVPYHRNLMNKYSLALNEADIIMRNRKSPKLAWVFEQSRKKKINDDLLIRALNYYDKIIANLRSELKISENELLPWVSPFYWNPFNYTEKIDIPTIWRTEIINPMHDFYKAYKKCSFGQMNFKETWGKGYTGDNWYNSQPTRVQDFSKTEKQLISGVEKKESVRETYKNNITNKITANSSSKMMKNLQSNEGVSNLSLQSSEEINYLLGGEGCSYIPMKQQGKLSKFNQSIPVFSYAMAFLESPSRYDSFRRSIDTPHAQLHNNQGSILSDPSFSILHPQFFLYHAFVQYMVELYYRRIQYEGKFSQLSSSLNRELTSSLQTGQLLRRKNQQFRTFFLAYLGQNRNLTTSQQYPMFQWIDNSTRVSPNLKNGVDYVSYDSYGNFMMLRENGQRRIRFSYEQKQFYQNKMGSLLLEPGLEEYPFNFEFDTFYQKGFNIPKYFEQVTSEVRFETVRSTSRVGSRIAMVEQVQIKKMTEEVSASRIERARNVVRQEDQIQIDSYLRFIFQEAIKRGAGPSMMQDQDLSKACPLTVQLLAKIKNRNKKFLKKVFDYSSLYGRIEYPANLENYVVSLSMSFKEGQREKFQFRNSGEQSISLIADEIKTHENNLVLGLYPVFQKGQLADVCPRCEEKKIITRNLAEYFKGNLLPLFVDLHVNANVGILYDSTGRSTIERSFSEIIQAHHNHPSNLFEFALPRGAREVAFSIIKCNNLNSEDTISYIDPKVSYKFTLEAQSFDLINEKDFVILQSHQEKLNTEITFEKIYLPNIQAEESEQSQEKKEKKSNLELVYRKFYGRLTKVVGFECTTKDFEFEIKNYYESASYDIRIDAEENILVRESNILEKNSVFF